MKYQRLLKIVYFLAPILILVIFALDLLSFYSQLTFGLVSFIRELVILSLIFIWFQVLKERLHFEELTVEQNLIRLAVLILANFLIYFSLKFIFHPVYEDSVFPPVYQSVGSIFVSAAIAITAVFTIVPALLILKQLIFYKRKRFTSLNFNIFLGAIILNALSVYLTKGSVGSFRFTAETFANDATMLLAVIPILILSFRNEWITYLPRKKKILYFLFGVPLFLGIVFLFDLVYRNALPAYSLTLAAVSYSMWIFLMLYGSVSILKLLFYLPTARAFDRKINELSSLYDLARRLNRETSQENLLPLISRAASEYLGSESTWLSLFNEKDQTFNIASSQYLSKDKLEQYPLVKFKGINYSIVNKNEPVLIPDVGHNRTVRSLLEWKKDARTLIGAPLFSNRGKLMGIIYATKSKEYHFDIDDVTLLEGIANQAAIALENVRLLEDSIERERMEQELKIARQVQLNLLPQEVPHVANFEINAFCRTAYEIGGDYYDFFQYSDGETGFIIGDVSGKGTSAALYMAEFKGIIQTLARNYDSPGSLARATNQIIYPNIERGSFISAIFGKICENKNQIFFSRAGHPHPVLHSERNGTPNFVLSRGIGIGLDPGSKFNQLIEEKAVTLGKGDSLIFFTDGLTEARNQNGEEFGEDNFLKLVAGTKPASAYNLKEKISKTLAEFSLNTQLHDDLTFLILKHQEADS